jgi:hypothetical protein
MEYVDFISDNRDWVIPLLQRWGGMNLVGAMLDVYFMFIHGKPGTGKTVFIDVLARLAHLYGTPVSKNFFMRTLDKRTFELYQTFKKRGCVQRRGAQELDLGRDDAPLNAQWQRAERRGQGQGFPQVSQRGDDHDHRQPQAGVRHQLGRERHRPAPAGARDQQEDCRAYA